MDVVHYLPGDPVLIDQIVCELKSQGIFDSFRKECISDVDTKPAYQNLRQRVEGSVSGFLRKQRWSPEMNKNHVREMLRKNIYESGFLEIGVERIVDQVVNPKMNTVFLPKVTEVVYKFLGIEKPNKSEKGDGEDNLLPNDLEAVSPMSDRHKDEKMDISESMDESKIDEDESPPFEPIEEPENSIDSHMSGFSGLVSHDSNQSDGAKPLQIDMDSQMSKQSSDGGQSSAVEDQKIENSEDSKSCESSDKSIGSKGDKVVKVEDKKDGKEKERSRRSSEKKSDKHTSRGERRDSERSREKERKDSKSDKDRRHSSSSKHSSSKSKSSSSKDSSRHRDEKSKSSSSSSKHDSHRKSSSSTSHSRDKDKDKKDNKKRSSRDDHYSSKHKTERRSTDRDSNDGSGLKSCSSSSNCESNSSTQTSTIQNNSKPQDSNSNSNDSGNSDGHEVRQSGIKLLKPKIASNIQEAKRLAKIRKEIDHLEKLKNEELEKLKIQELEKAKEEERIVEKPSFSASLLSWEAMEAQLSQTLNYDSYGDPDKSNDDDDVVTAVSVDEVKYFNDTTVEDEANYKIGQETISKLSIDISTLKKKMEENLNECTATDNCRENKENKRTGIKRKMNDNKAYEKAKNNNNFINDCYVLVSNHHVDERFSLPLSPADSDQVDDEEKPKRNIVKRQRYESEDLYKPRPTITPTSRRRTATKME
ncbi:PREDICTED: biorientation of chromosomes in cell division protein 1-like 1 isoform X2 [Nicrophorus vespilloides]|uniref:Biorientation of chromosomes in cell division protein 1-like 1 isoform X2 n=1 Tax=Nicrophorus vespilloides TaxID=110193 RepID=A0ABM1NI00_NICVS|nr:PREDICTED: biorientation of chromosomes in cell division protein 1-like 1 isoform X2 [Nicrophorus vespilloides]